MTKRRDQKTEELSVSDLEEMLAKAGPQPPGPMKSKPSVPPPPPPQKKPSPQVSVEDSFVETVIDGRYEVVRCLGTGAMGIVFLVRHVRLNKLFALKIIHPSLAQLPEFAARFEREADACSRLQHPNCISVTDFGQDVDGRLFLVMEYVEGTLLNTAVGEKPLSMMEAMQYAKQILLGLRHAHKEGLVHRDIKMENVVRCAGDDGTPVLKILDFGMAKHPVMDNLTVAGNPDGVVMGTPQYMSPEQIRDDGVDARTDLYAVGVTLFRMISDTPVFKGAGPLDVFMNKMAEKAPSLVQVTGKTYPAALEAFLAKALERDPADRFADADEMIDALDRVMESVRIEIGTVPLLPTRSFRFWSGHKKWAVMAAAVAVIVGTAAVFVAGRSGNEAIDSVEAAAAADASVSAGPGSANGGVPAPSVGASPIETPAAKPDTAVDAKAEAAMLSMDADTPPDPLLIEAALLLERRECRKAEKLLKTAEGSDNARVQYFLGRAAVCRRQEAEALAYYQSAIKLDGRYRTDTGILEDAERMLASHKVRDRVISFMAEDIGKTALPTLIQTAGHHKTRLVRQAALAAVERLGALDHVDLVSSYELDLNQAGSCKEKRIMVAKIAALNTKAAKQVLVRARDAQVRVNIFRSRYANECIRPDIQRALSDMP